MARDKMETELASAFAGTEEYFLRSCNFKSTASRSIPTRCSTTTFVELDNHYYAIAYGHELIVANTNDEIECSFDTR